MHIDICRAYFNIPTKEKSYIDLPSDMWLVGVLEHIRVRLSLYGTRHTAKIWRKPCCKVLGGA